MKEMLFLVNPCAGQKKAKRYLADMIDLFNRAGYAVWTHMTSQPGEGEKVVKEFAHRVDLIVACGGDGTFNETISGVMKSGADVRIGYIPAGSTNDYAASLHLSTNIMQATRDVLEGSAEKLDVGMFGERYYSYVASFGAFTRASYATPQNAKNLLGHMAYVLSGMQELTQIRSYHLRFELPNDELIEDDYIFGAVSNSLSVGGILTLAEDRVDLTDGKFELLLIRTPKNLQELTECVLALQKKTYDSPVLTFRSVPWVRITAPADMEWTLDGEREDPHETVDVKCIRQAVNVVRNLDTGKNP